MAQVSSPSILNLASHPNPYPYYASLLATPLYYDESLGLWIASSAAVIRAIFESHDCVVRPAAEKVPKTLVGSSAGEVFHSLIRMNEGHQHQCGKQILQSTLGSLKYLEHEQKFQQLLERLAPSSALQDGSHLNALIVNYPVSAVGILLGFDDSELDSLQQYIADFVRCLSPLSTAEQLVAASQAAQQLQQRFTDLLNNAQAKPNSVLANLQSQAHHYDWQSSLIANLIGLLSQTYEASTALFGNCIIALHQHPELRQHLHQHTEELINFVTEVARYDAPIQNTRRFVLNDCTIAHQTLKAGDSILLLLAAGNRDPNLHHNPNQLQLQREHFSMYSF